MNRTGEDSVPKPGSSTEHKKRETLRSPPFVFDQPGANRSIGEISSRTLSSLNNSSDSTISLFLVYCQAASLRSLYGILSCHWCPGFTKRRTAAFSILLADSTLLICVCLSYFFIRIRNAELNQDIAPRQNTLHC